MNQRLPDQKTIAMAKHASKEYICNFIGSWGMMVNGFHFQPGCELCESPRIKKLPRPFQANDGKKYYFECQDCKKPVDYTAVYPKKGGHNT